jgi:hypothetical protein
MSKVFGWDEDASFSVFEANSEVEYGELDADRGGADVVDFSGEADRGSGWS